MHAVQKGEKDLIGLRARVGRCPGSSVTPAGPEIFEHTRAVPQPVLLARGPRRGRENGVAAVHAAVVKTRANSLGDLSGSGDDVLVDEWLGWWARHTDNTDIENQISTDDGLASRLKKGTEQAHEEAENVAFVKLLLKGKAPLESYIALIAALKPIYGALEKAAALTAATSARMWTWVWTWVRTWV